jgi:RimJ/RimL family protein N-acetyltransferase
MSGGPVGDLPQPGHLLEEGVEAHSMSVLRQLPTATGVVRPERTWETARLLAKPAVVEDAQVVFDEYASDLHVAKYMTWTPHRSVTDTKDFLSRCERAWSDGSAYPWTLWRKQDGGFVGLLERIGMEREGVLRRWILHPNVGDTPRDSFCYSVVR